MMVGIRVQPISSPKIPLQQSMLNIRTRLKEDVCYTLDLSDKYNTKEAI
jgi:hypothetical protein